jgi:hypothetical protein
VKEKEMLMSAVLVEDFDREGRCPHPDCLSEELSPIDESRGGARVLFCEKCRNHFVVIIRRIRRVKLGKETVHLRIVRYPEAHVPVEFQEYSGAWR